MADKTTKSQRIRELALQGKSIREIKEILDTDEGWARSVVNRHGLPTNREIHPGSHLERDILTTLVVMGFTGNQRPRQDIIKDVAHVYRQTPDRIWDIINRKALS